VREKIAGRALLLDPDFAEELPVLFDFLGVPDPDRPLPQLSPEARQRALRGVVCRLVRAPNRREPIVVVIEDLHWLDEGSAGMIGELLGAVEGTQTLVVANFRPEYSPRWAEASGQPQIALAPLGPAGTRELLRDLAGEDPSLDGLAELVHRRTAGNPFFVEEIVRGLAEAGNLEGERGAYRLARPVEDAGVPASVQTVLAARIDRLAPDAKLLLQAASVVGKEVGERALQKVCGLGYEELGAALGELVEAGFLYEAEAHPERFFAFHHPLTRDVAYGTQLAEQRARTHAATAHALVELNPDRLDEMAALIAGHMGEGGETLEAARWSARAAYWTGSSQPHEALRLWRATMELTDRVEPSPETRALAVTSRLLQLDYAWRLGMDDEEEARLAAEAEEIATGSGDLRALALLRMATAARPGIAHEAGEWIAAAEDANRLADESGDDHLRVAIRAAGSYARLSAGDFDGFERVLDEVLELAGEDSATGAGIVLACPVAWALTGKAMVRKERGEAGAAGELLAAALRVAGEVGDPETASWIRGTQAMLRSAQGDLEGGVALGRRNCELTERLGDVFSRSLALANLCAAQLAAGEFGAALDSIEEAERTYREAMGDGGEMEAWRGALRAQALLGAGRGEEAVEVAEVAVATARERGLRWPLPLALLALGLARGATRREGADEALAEAAAVAGETGAITTLAAIEDARDAIPATAR
jgi:adenylate cyclase